MTMDHHHTTTTTATTASEQITGDRIGHYIVELELERTVQPDGRLEVLWRARHQVLPRRVAIKVSSDKRSILHEACILEALLHPGIVRIHETGLLKDRRAWFARELVPGPSLTTVLPADSMARVDAVALLRDLAEVLEHAHTRGVIHAGLRPDRVILAGRTRAYPIALANWTAARAHDAGAIEVAPPRSGWQYIAPEQANGDALDDRADIYSLGVIAYRLLTGTLPFDRAHTATQLHVPTEVHCADAPRELTLLVDQMLAFDRWDRPSASEVRDALTGVAAAMPSRRRSRWTSDAPTPRATGTRDLEAVLVEGDDELQHS